METDYQLIVSRDFSTLKIRYEGYLYRLACAFTENQSMQARELTELTFRMLSSVPYTGEYAFHRGQPTVKRFLANLLVTGWTEMMVRQRVSHSFAIVSDRT